MPPEEASTSEDMNKQVVADFLKDKKKFSNKTILIIVLVFAALGGFLLWRSFALTNVVLVAEVENLQPASAPHESTHISTPFTDTSSPDYSVLAGYNASNGNVYKFSWENTSAGSNSNLNGSVLSSGTVTLPNDATSLSIKAVGKQCGNNRLPYVGISIDGHAVFPVNQYASNKPLVHVSTTWKDYSANFAVTQGTHTITVDAENLGALNSNYCSDPLYADAITFYGPSAPATPPPAAPGITLTASPNPINTGQSSTLSWNTTNADSCQTYGGAWGSNQSEPINSTYTTGALSTSTTYTLQCSGAGGTKSQSVTVNVNPISPPPASPPPADANANMIVGVVSGYFGDAGVTDIKGSVDYTRLDATTSFPNINGKQIDINTWRNKGVKVDLLFPGDTSGNYDSTGVKTITGTDPSDNTKINAWTNYVLNKYHQVKCDVNSSGAVDTSECPTIEVLNEPGGTWYWGSTALSSSNYSAYARLVDATYLAFHAKYGDKSPKVLATYDGSYPIETWGQGWWPLLQDKSHVDGIVVHPYGGAPKNPTFQQVQASAQGNHQLVEDAHNATGKPIYVTEVGWPTATSQTSTGDSLQWTQEEQADNIYSFVNWARDQGYINMVMIFNYRDYGTKNWYGITTGFGTDNPANLKPSYYSLHCAALNQSWTYPNKTCGP